MLNWPGVKRCMPWPPKYAINCADCSLFVPKTQSVIVMCTFKNHSWRQCTMHSACSSTRCLLHTPWRKPHRWCLLRHARAPGSLKSSSSASWFVSKERYWNCMPLMCSFTSRGRVTLGCQFVSLAFLSTPFAPSLAVNNQRRAQQLQKQLLSRADLKPLPFWNFDVCRLLLLVQTGCDQNAYDAFPAPAIASTECNQQKHIAFKTCICLSWGHHYWNVDLGITYTVLWWGPLTTGEGSLVFHLHACRAVLNGQWQIWKRTAVANL